MEVLGIIKTISLIFLLLALQPLNLVVIIVFAWPLSFILFYMISRRRYVNVWVLLIQIFLSAGSIVPFWLDFVFSSKRVHLAQYFLFSALMAFLLVSMLQFIILIAGKIKQRRSIHSQ
jgi:hypothetical protein